MLRGLGTTVTEDADVVAVVEERLAAHDPVAERAVAFHSSSRPCRNAPADLGSGV